MDAAYKYIDFAVDTGFEDLPTEVVDLAKQDFMDCIGNLLGGSSEPGVVLSMDVMRGIGGVPESRVLPYEFSLPAHDAAFLMAQMVNVLDYDDTHEYATAHMGAALVPAILAAAEKAGGASGKEVITAMAVALEVISRVGKYAKRRHPEIHMGGWSHLTLLGYFSASIASSRLMGLNKEQMHNALGIAYLQASGSNLIDCGHTSNKILGPGFGARGGVFSARLAQYGMTGPRAIFDQEKTSFSNMYHNGTDSEALVADLGTRYEMLGLSLKPYSCFRGSHKHADAVLKLVRENDIHPNEIISLEYGAEAGRAGFVPTAENTRPERKVDAQFSVPWITACAAVRRKVGIAEFEDAARKDPDILRVASLVKCTPDGTLTSAFDPTFVRIVTTRGTFETMTGIPYGDMRNPMSAEDLEAKFRANAAFGWRKGSPEKVDRIFEQLADLEKLDDIMTLVDLIR